jgi:hypothetical protein
MTPYLAPKRSGVRPSRRSIRTISALAGLVCVALLGRGAAQEAGPGLVLAVKAEKAVYRVGTAVNIVLEFSNRSPRRLMLNVDYNSGGVCYLRIHAISPSGIELTPKLVQHGHRERGVTLRPGGVHQERLDLASWVTLNEPGDYRVSIAYVNRWPGSPPDTFWTGETRSPEVKLHLITP